MKYKTRFCHVGNAKIISIPLFNLLLLTFKEIVGDTRIYQMMEQLQ